MASLLLLFVIRSDQGSVAFALVFTLLLLPVVIATAYGFTYWLFPRYLYQGKMVPFAFYGLFLFVASIYLETMIILWSLVYLGDYRFANMTPITTNIAQLGLALYFVVFVFTITHLIRHRVLAPSPQEEQPYLQVRSDRQTKQIPRSEITYIESLDDYVTIHMSAEDVTTRMGINKLTKELSPGFVRIHRSFLVNKQHVKSYTREKVTVGEVALPIGRTYKKAALAAFEA